MSDKPITFSSTLAKEVLEARSRRRRKRVDWYEFIDIDTTLCALCGNTGILKTAALNPRGTIELGYEGPCVCPNGRSFKRSGGLQGSTWHKRLKQED